MIPERALARAELDFEATFEAQYPRVARIIARIVHDPSRAEDLAVDVFCKLWRQCTHPGDHVDAWLSRAAVCAGVDEIRKQARRAKYERYAGWLLAPRTPEALHAATEEQTRVRTVLASMSPRDAQMLVLRSDGLAYQEIAEALELNPSSVGTMLGRAQDSFRKEYVTRYGH